LTRADGNEEALRNIAIRNAQALGCGHTFVLVVQNAYPINILNAIRNVPEVCSIFCATANPVEIVVAQTEQGRGVLGVIDGSSPKGVEGQAEIAWRHELLRKIGYKR
jgi:adenosine/AMP kinase